MKNKIKNILGEAFDVHNRILDDKIILQNIERSVEILINAFNKGNKLLLCGNGGSAADAQHIAAELSGRFYKDRKPLFAEALHVNSSFVTAVANDYGYENIYSRMTEAAGKDGDVLIAISTSGNSLNIINAVHKANMLGMHTVGFTGEDGGNIKEFCDLMIQIPSSDTPRIQEGHILVGHIICELIEESLF